MLRRSVSAFWESEYLTIASSFCFQVLKKTGWIEIFYIGTGFTFVQGGPECSQPGFIFL